MSSPPRSDVDVAQLSARLRLSITRLARQLRQTSDSALTPTQQAVLATIARHGPLTLGEVAEREQVAAPTITKVAGLLHDQGLISREPDPDDRRFVRVAVTTQGQALLEHIRARRTAWLTTQLRDLPAEELARLEAAADVLEQLTDRERST